MSTTGVDENEGQCPLILYIYLGQLFYLACCSSHLYDGVLSLKLLSLHSKLSKDCILWLKVSLKWWLGPQVAWLVPQVDLTCTPSHPKVVPYASRYRHLLATAS
jgi:hypothetical protein